jgi:oxygen-independent coproporphyrinogen-3 oxidase
LKSEKVKNKLHNEKLRELGLYIHIPFCVKKCDYCDFLSAPAEEAVKQRYLEALLIQIRSYQGKMDDIIVPTIFIGGGTPSCLEASYINEIMKAVNEVFLIASDRLEATIEVNPGTVTKEKLLAYKAAGINRLSFGLQSVDNQELKMLGRIHSYEQFEENYLAAREAGFHNINVDLMSALPGQTQKSWENTLNKIASLNPEHISAYSLIIEEGTPFFLRYGEGSAGATRLPEEDLDRELYHRTREILSSYGYQRYEISNYAKEGFESRHNSSYWTLKEYLGIGLGASSLLLSSNNSTSATDENYLRFHIEEDLECYIKQCLQYQQRQQRSNAQNMEVSNQEEDPIGILRDIEHLSKRSRMEEFMFLGLRMDQGVSQDEFYHKFHITMDDLYHKEIMQMSEQHLLRLEGNRLKLTEYGIDVSNVVLAKFLLDQER